MRVLWSNFGGEEGLPPSCPDQPERFVGASSLNAAFTSLFEDGAPFADAMGFIAWFNNAPAQQAARLHRLPLFGSSPETVARVHDKAFVATASTQTTVLDANEVSEDRLQQARQAAGPTAVIKARLSTSGRGRIAPHQRLTARVIARMRQQGGCIVEPWLMRTLDLSSLWRIHDDRIECMAQTVAEVDEQGVFRATQLQRVDGHWRSGTKWDDALLSAASVQVEAAAAAGLRGPCGVDAFIHNGVDGSAPSQLQVCELNARFTVGMVAAAQAMARGGQSFVFRLADACEKRSMMNVNPATTK
jgi:hypothetical protein